MGSSLLRILGEEVGLLLVLRPQTSCRSYRCVTSLPALPKSDDRAPTEDELASPHKEGGDREELNHDSDEDDVAHGNGVSEAVGAQRGLDGISTPSERVLTPRADASSKGALRSSGGA